MLELDLEPCGEDVVKGCLAIRTEIENNPALLECIDELIGYVIDRLRLDGDSESQPPASMSESSCQQVDEIHLAK